MTEPNKKKQDVIIIGTGPAGLTAGLYAVRDGLETIFFEKESIGGELMNRHEIRGFPGFPDGIAGTDLRSKLTTALDQYESQVLLDEVNAISPGTPHTVQTASGEYFADIVIVATGGRPKQLGIPGEEQYLGYGIFHCAECDGPLYRDEIVAVAGGNSHAIIDALHLADFASEVIVIEPNSELAANSPLQDEAASTPNLTIETNTELISINGENNILKSLQLRDAEDNTEKVEEVGGLYVHTGIEPNSEFIEGTGLLDNDGRVKVDAKMETEIDGIFAIGDVRQYSSQTVASAVGDGITAVKAAKDNL
ncbi:NAD(P)/FAD-dependent oxidoreductase [Natronorubrum sp. FCH18a]|uniref:NAD(P)/FAD-dependent oxidoreductase n=1 Tax=Natronorubrum sp. FCH18a TaxID=3447018 RepID=UPI003F511EA9